MDSKTFFTADEHYAHENIIHYTNRPWDKIKHHDKGLVKAHNEVVEEDSVVWHLGDFTMAPAEFAGRIKRQVTHRLNGLHHLVLGNHDSWKPFRYVEDGFVSVHTSFWFKYGGYTFLLAHDPSIYTIIDNDKKAFMLCGHIHKLFKHLMPERRIINVGVDVWNYKPVSFFQICGLIKENGWEIEAP